LDKVAKENNRSRSSMIELLLIFALKEHERGKLRITAKTPANVVEYLAMVDETLTRLISKDEDLERKIKELNEGKEEKKT